ncbi:hypothetical protein JCM33374_g1021 [Metschnikowia sp. JCM 33374]|nr:hypothetical protein JCM33374_g1021 [Metschnikowia sp. JCM 33374]
MKRTNRVGTRSKTGCLARFSINFPGGYVHDPGNFINVKDFGEMTVLITWKSKHNHNFNNSEQCAAEPLSKKGKELLQKAIENGMTMTDILYQQSTHQRNGTVSYFSEIHKVTTENLRYIKRSKLDNKAICHRNIETSLRQRAELIESEGGLSEFRDEFPSLDGNHILKDLKSSKGLKVWSFWIMTKWQRSLMKENSKVFHLDATHNTCYGIKNTDTVYFFTVVIKNKISGDGAPLAFMLTNAGNAIVIADFLKQLKSRASFNPTQAVTDCDEAETSAIKNALNIPLSWCRYHVRTAFHKQARSKINKGENFISDLEEAKDDFLEILNSPTALEGDDRINKFLDKFKEHKALVKYMPQWFNNRKYIIIGYNDIFCDRASTNNLHITKL